MEPDQTNTNARAGTPHDSAPGLRADAGPLLVKRETFNVGFDAKDPAEFLGALLGGFSQNFTLDLPESAQGRSQELVRAIYDRVATKTAAGHLATTSPEIVFYSDGKYPAEGPRVYVRFTTRTVRDTHLTTLFRCSVYGRANLYVALDSYRLGGIAVRPVVLRALVTAVVLLLTLMSLLNPLGLLPMLVVTAAVVWYFWGQTLRAARSRGLSGALRTTYPARLKSSSFDYDDTMMHLRSLLPAIMESIREVGPGFGLDLQTLEDLISGLTEKVRGQTVTIENHGTMSGVTVGGHGNHAFGGNR